MRLLCPIPLRIYCTYSVLVRSAASSPPLYGLNLVFIAAASREIGNHARVDLTTTSLESYLGESTRWYHVSCGTVPQDRDAIGTQGDRSSTFQKTHTRCQAASSRLPITAVA
ncbi:hypothetical protein BD414DRAFT_43850 [Trametes punicea]|nr:hypothetical protein BD414DRAFT_43850 [Trametes punicea]